MPEDTCGHTNTPPSAAYATSESVHCLLWFYPPQVVVTLMGCCGLSGYITNQHRLQEPLLSYTSPPCARTGRLYFKASSVNRPERNPKTVLNPHRLWTLLLLGSRYSKLMHEKQKKCRVPVNSRIPSRPKWTRWIALKQGCLSRVLRTHTAIYTCYQVVDSLL